MIYVQAEEAFDESDDNKIDIEEATTSENIERIKDSDKVAITFNATEEEEVTISGDNECVKLSRVDFIEEVIDVSRVHTKTTPEDSF